MTREQAKQTLISIGIEEPSDEQVTKYLDSINGEVKKDKEKILSLKEKADKASDLEKELDELKKQNMTEAEKLEDERRKEKEAVEKKIADLESALAESNKKALTSDITSIFSKAGLTGDPYKSVISAFSAMPAEDARKAAESFVNGVSEENKAALETARSSWEKEVLEGTPNPGGGNKSQRTEPKSKAEEYFSKYLAPQKSTINTQNSEGEK